MLNVWTVAVEFLLIKLRGRLLKYQVWDVLQLWNLSHGPRCVLCLNWSHCYSTLVHSNFFSHLIYNLSFCYHHRSSNISGLEKHGCKCGLVSACMRVPGQGKLKHILHTLAISSSLDLLPRVWLPHSSAHTSSGTHTHTWSHTTLQLQNKVIAHSRVGLRARTRFYSTDENKI